LPPNYYSGKCGWTRKDKSRLSIEDIDGPNFNEGYWFEPKQGLSICKPNVTCHQLTVESEAENMPLVNIPKNRTSSSNLFQFANLLKVRLYYVITGHDRRRPSLGL